MPTTRLYTFWNRFVMPCATIGIVAALAFLVFVPMTDAYQLIAALMCLVSSIASLIDFVIKRPVANKNEPTTIDRTSN